jgi:hypothetical protein
MNLYCVTYQGHTYPWYRYIQSDDIIELAKELNAKKYEDTILEVSISQDFRQPNKRIFFQTEYNSQKFLETYEERLLEQYKIENLAV